MFIILTNQDTPIYITGVEEVAKEYCRKENLQSNNNLGLYYKEIRVLGPIDKDCSGLNEFIEAVPSCEFDEAMMTVMTPENKHFILTQLGLEGRGKGLWWHRAFGADIPTNRLSFSLADNNIKHLPNLIYNKVYIGFKTQMEVALGGIEYPDAAN